MSCLRIIESLRVPRHVWIRRCLYTLLVIGVLDSTPLVTDKDHVHVWIEKIPVFWSVFGLLGCVMIIVVSKWFGHTGIMKEEGYYDE
jgi:hypothetical protein